MSAEVTELTWRRFLDPAEPMHALGCFADGELRGILHYIFHRSCWTEGPYCYLQDLFTHLDFRGGGIGRR
jgi:GNAT superfamily N-acetyltransferase